MAEIIETGVYRLHELSDEAKDKARGWYREVGFDFDWYGAMRDMARWLYRRLEREYDYQTSGASFDEAITANAYTFTATGRRFG